MADTAPEHGERRRYQRGCKCPRCMAANRDYQRRYRSARSPATVSASRPTPEQLRLEAAEG